MVEINYEWRGLGDTARRDLPARVQKTLRTFFRYKEIPAPMTIVGLKASRGIGGGTLIRVLPTADQRPEAQRPDFLPVSIFLEGNQGLECFMGLEKHSSDELRTLIDGGPYKSKPRCVKVKKEAPALLEAAPHCDAPVTQEVEVLSPPPVVVFPAIEKVARTTPHEKLVQADLSKEQIDRLKVTLSTIISREVARRKLTEVPNTLQVSVPNITKAIIEHMQLATNQAGNYRGTIANFYTSRIALFALKWESRLEPDDASSDWLFDCSLVIDFVEGLDKLRHLSREREKEVAERLAKEAQPQTPPPVAAQVEEAIKEGSSDESIFHLAMQALEGRKQAEREVVHAEENVASFRTIVEDLSNKLRMANEELAGAMIGHASALRRRDEFVIEPAVLTKVREAKARYDQLARDLGL